MADKLFSALLKYWRGRRGLSQLDLAMAADVSARHLSFLESGRASPSEEMVLRLMSTLALPLRDQNTVLRAASFPARFPEPALDTIDPVIGRTIAHMLRQQEPFPLVVMNAGYDVLRTNDAANTVFSHFVVDPARLLMTVNLYGLVFDPQLARPFIKNWPRVGQYMISRLHREALSRPDDARLWALLKRVLAYPDVPPSWRHPDFSGICEPTLSLQLERGPLALGFLTAVTVFSAPQQVTLDELRIESYFPMDDQTRLACERLAATTPVATALTGLTSP
ncbi:helix-turn-helix domain-containing protein [Rhodoferax sp.]|uniref:helix-turn-helix domain-containing protein n=1 Tax=Rhodoferax sp. TaxID=50421 RepID=UPI00260E256F|nr:helix-turn-helix domain-containing protein [Rhodoferax sp.]MDD2926697.1 helix-turn-helix domain-containing protein [Rhodoferax sp.]